MANTSVDVPAKRGVTDQVTSESPCHGRVLVASTDHNGRFVVRADPGSVEMVMHGVGYVRCEKTYSVSGCLLHGDDPCVEEHEWCMMCVTAVIAGNASVGDCVVLHRVTYDWRDGTKQELIEWWPVPACAAALPAPLALSGIEEEERLLFRGITPAARISEGFPAAVHVPAVPLETLSRRVREQLDLVAHAFVEKSDGRPSFSGEPVAGARLFIPWRAEGMNRSISSMWIWRCAYPVAVGGSQGVLVVETRRMDVDAAEETGDMLGAERGCEAQGWLLLPCNAERAAKVVEEPGGVCLGIVPVHPPDPATIVIPRW